MPIEDEVIIDACRRSCELDWSVTSVDLLRAETGLSGTDCERAITLAAVRGLVSFGSSPHYAWVVR